MILENLARRTTTTIITITTFALIVTIFIFA